MSPDSGAALNETEPCGADGFVMTRCNPDARRGAEGENGALSCAVRYGLLNYVGEFRYAPNVIRGCGDKVVIQTNRGIEIGRRISLTCTGCDNSIGRQRMLTYSQTSGTELFQPKAGRILRTANAQDLQEEAKINADSVKKLEQARSLAQAKNLPMEFVACEHLFGGERIIYHFMSEDRIDFRELVRDLAHEYHTRIEMHQIGARDEARLVADYEICGRECCCKNFLKKLHPVTMRMAKLQKATLDPSKVSGRCGRLRCCLRYEHEGYEELAAKLPRPGARVRTERGIATIKDRQILTQLVILEYDDTGNLEALGLEAILETGLPKRPPMPLSPEPRPGSREDRERARTNAGRQAGMGEGGRRAPEGSGRALGGRDDRRNERGLADARRGSEPAEAQPETAEAIPDQEEPFEGTEAGMGDADVAAVEGSIGQEASRRETADRPPPAGAELQEGLRRGRRRRRRGGRGRRGDHRSGGPGGMAGNAPPTEPARGGSPPGQDPAQTDRRPPEGSEGG